MAIRFENGKVVFDDAEANACPTDPDELNQCDGCQ